MEYLTAGIFVCFAFVFGVAIGREIEQRVFPWGRCPYCEKEHGKQCHEDLLKEFHK